jgi:hypothetical protein
MEELQVNLVKNKKGEVVATFEDASRARPVPPKGYTIEAVEAHEDYLKNLKTFYKEHSTTRKTRSKG